MTATSRTVRAMMVAAIASLALLSAPLAIAAGPAPFDQAAQQDLGQAVAAYGKAWASRDPDAIVARHADETEFVLHVPGAEPVRTKADVRAQFAAILKAQPEYASEVEELKLGPGFAMIRYEIIASAKEPFALGNVVYTPDGSDYRIPAIDVIAFEDGLVTSKHTYVDTETIRAHSSEVSKASD